MKIQTSQLFLYVKERRTEKHIFKWPNANDSQENNFFNILF